jgi:hypothetical protein
MRDFKDFAICCRMLTEGSALQEVYCMFEARREMELTGVNGNHISAELGKQQDKLRSLLKRKKIITDLDGSQSLFVCDLFPNYTSY